MVDIYNYDTQLEAELRKLGESKISKRNKEIILKFKSDLEDLDYSKPRIIKYLNKLRLIAEILKVDFDKANKEDIREFVNKIKKRDDLAEWTKSDYKTIIKKFYKYLRGNDEHYPEEVTWIKTNVKNGKRLPEEILNEDDIRKLIDNANNIRDKAIISVLFDSGMRIGELASLKIKHVVFEDKFARIIIPDGKTGSRRILLYPSVPYLANWIENHPDKKPDSLLWVGLANRNYLQPMKYSSFYVMIKKIAKKIGLTKRVGCHQFRHGSVTFSAKYMTEAQLKERFGWVQGSKMAGVYVHLAGRDVDNIYKKMHGLEVEEDKKKSKLEPKQCPFCKKMNGALSEFCDRCGRPLSLKKAIEISEKRKNADIVMDEVKLRKPEEFKQLVTDIIKELVSEGKLLPTSKLEKQNPL